MHWVFALSELSYLESLLIIPLTLGATKQNDVFLEVVPKGRRQKYLSSDPLSLVRMWLTSSSCGRPHLALDTILYGLVV